jgi:hypothetical protein
MTVDKLTKEEKSWLRKMQNLLDKCPKHFAFNTTGDNDVAVFDNRKIQEVYAIADERHGEFSNAIDEAGAHVGYLRFPNPVHSTAG